ncbi:hypothetical protein SSP24_81520 [Streptomyces spinoverrucosus]|uniref:Pyridoxamine 5'-phosphate oxidase N-terminal domain-containing protein n=1 Tax=Streptomyces spinoverrucosus TaxID=284043 RepID=A0A4Y3VUG1_9ACTN|nr:pyridoxamine 5'-phosphate oxidase family protein [Streptomyces spinoverrucosus]GEC10497.1 hypothetical protein SSP24_81520 [Streptomyces spinoverrucosus]GHB96233.1 hypothetical protein GCM10010397_81060 [Streptomyces spinoverrucosus]
MTRSDGLMEDEGFTEVGSEAELRELIARPDAPVERKQLSRLDAHARTWIARSPFCLLATAGADGTCDVSPRGDAPGFVHVPSDRALAIPDRPGNRRLDGLRNILANPHAGLLFVIPGIQETLRVNGRARIISNAPFMQDMAVHGKRPVLALWLEVEEAYFHCARAFKRSRLWDAGQWPDRAGVPTFGRILKDQLRLDRPAAELDALIAARDRDELYP